MIAMALCSGAELLIADEPTTRAGRDHPAQILELLVKLRDQQGFPFCSSPTTWAWWLKPASGWRWLTPGNCGNRPHPAVLARRLHPYTEGLCRPAHAVQKGQTLQPIAGRCPTVCSPSAAARSTRAAARRCRCARRSTLPCCRLKAQIT